ncbi:immunity 52 family protein [Paraburkholderia sp. MMS20-SJTN17]|uniref:Immunity 52 family protein n=1 Tax=Paraburkholderia translucens TaxID=2886945 RepID=A0ABS8K6M5_9BURK|nr:immunity 52 family protein [Paraburkholderia sp. MMS20-SJTN17]MCC8400396.1 immunity 52 family protein [Paraburkholderia sp. MMS20-SJTN17]
MEQRKQDESAHVKVANDIEIRLANQDLWLRFIDL